MLGGPTIALRRRMNRSVLFGAVSLVALSVFGCAVETAGTTTANESELREVSATLKLAGDFTSSVTGSARAGSDLSVIYDLSRAPKLDKNCVRTANGGGRGWALTGKYQRNGGEVGSLDFTARMPQNGDATGMVEARIPLTEGGDLSVWFEVTSLGGCQAFDSQLSQNYHVSVSGPPPGSEASIVFGAAGDPVTRGTLRAGGRVAVRFEDARLPKCRGTRMGNPAWGIRGSAQVNDSAPKQFDTGRTVDAKGTRESIEAVVALPDSGKLSLWFENSDVFGCHDYDSQGGKNYTFEIVR